MTHFVDSLPFSWEAPGAQELLELLVSVYDEQAPVKAMARQAGVVTGRVNWAQPMQGAWFELITAARNQDRLRALLEQVASGPDRAVADRVAELLAAEPVVEAPAAEPPAGTWKHFTEPDTRERQIFRTPTFQDVAFLRRGVEMASAVCRLLVAGADGGQYHGTAFRIGQDLLLTNHHVLVCGSGRPPSAVEAWFGYEQDLDGRELEHTTVVCDPVPLAGEAGPDWAVVRTAAPVPDGTAVVAVPGSAPVAAGDRVCIVQHPYGGVKKLAARHNVVRHVDEDVVQYWTDTDSGSSGAPVFDERWRLVALHRRWTRIGPLSRAGEFRNEGLRIGRVAEGLARAGLV
jgi:trypsin-like peptidase/effector-associated domain 1 (EAD1)-containing protein